MGATRDGLWLAVVSGLALTCLAAAVGMTAAWSSSTAATSLGKALGAPVNARALNGGSITFKVYLCGLTREVWDDYVPWEVCRVKLVGCPTNGVDHPDCAHW